MSNKSIPYEEDLSVWLQDAENTAEYLNTTQPLKMGTSLCCFLRFETWQKHGEA